MNFLKQLFTLGSVKIVDYSTILNSPLVKNCYILLKKSHFFGALDTVVSDNKKKSSP